MNLDSPKRRDAAFAPGFPLAYLITFTTYGTRLHGDDRGSVNTNNNLHQTPYLNENRQINQWQRQLLRAEPLILSTPHRKIVHRMIENAARHNGWDIRALNVRTNHVHVVIAGDATPEFIMNSLKSKSTRGLKEHGIIRENGTYWTRHGSTEYLWTAQEVGAACHYVIERQGEDLQCEV